MSEAHGADLVCLECPHPTAKSHSRLGVILGVQFESLYASVLV